MPGTGPVKPADSTPFQFEKCELSFQQTADTSRSTSVEITLYQKFDPEQGTPVQIEGMPGFKKTRGLDCEIAVSIPEAPKYGVTASSRRQSGDPCETPLEAMNVVVREIKSGSAPRYAIAAGSALPLTLCSAVGVPAGADGKPGNFSVDDDELHQCRWYSDAVGLYTLHLRVGTGKDLTLDGQQVVDVAGSKAFEKAEIGEAKIDRCTLTWTHRKIDSYYAEELSLEYTPDPEPADPKETCVKAEAFTKNVMTRLPPVK